MLRKDDVVYYKAKLYELFNQAQQHDIQIKMNNNEIYLFDSVTGEMVCVKLKIKDSEQIERCGIGIHDDPSDKYTRNFE